MLKIEKNAKLTTKSKQFVVNGLVDWRCEFCNFSFDTKTQLNNHAKNSKCSSKFYKKYRIQVLFPWNNTSGKTSNCKVCGSIIEFKSEYCKKCSCKITANTPNFKKISSESKLGNKHWLRKEGVSHPNKGKSFEEQFGIEKAKKLKKHLSKIQTEKMLNGWSRYMNSFNTGKPSKPQLKLYKLVKSLYPESDLEYMLDGLNYVIDIAIPSKMIAIEYDGSYWHQDNNYDNKRQKNIEDRGWKFLRYRDYVPNINDLKSDILKIIEGD